VTGLLDKLLTPAHSPLGDAGDFGVMVIWHKPEFRDAVAPLVESLGYSCGLVASATAGLGLVVRRACTIIMEAEHPEMSGVAFAEELAHRLGVRRSLARVVLVQERPDYETAVSALRAGVADLLTLPLSPAGVARALRSARPERGLSVGAEAQMDGSSAITPFENQILSTVGAIRAMRSLRSRYFEERNLVDPAWDILLDLTQARLRGERLSVSSVCTGVLRSTATALRMIKALEAQGLVLRESDASDRRRAFVQLSEEAFDRMVEFAQHVGTYF